MRLLAAGLLALAAWLPAQPAAADWQEDLCGRLARSVERAHGIPRGLVEAVALAESGRWNGEGRGSRPWPWTVTSGADSFYLPSKQAAIAKVEELQALGRTNIDVGCMQVNLHYHGDRFASLEQALDPATNVQYGASFLRALRAETQSWGRATARYHSRTPERGERYRAKVYRLWNEVRRRGGDGRAQIALSALEREAGPLTGAAIRPEDAGPSRLKRPLIDLGARSAPPAGVRIMRGN